MSHITIFGGGLMDQGTLVIILAALLAVSEALALIPGLKSNSVFTLIVNILKTLVGPKAP